MEYLSENTTKLFQQILQNQLISVSKMYYNKQTQVYTLLKCEGIAGKISLLSLVCISVLQWKESLLQKYVQMKSLKVGEQE